MGFEIEGFLEIYTNLIRGYKKRYFLLQNGILSFSKSKTQSPMLSLGFIKISKATIKSDTKSGSSSFRVMIKKKNWLLRASSTEERDNWVSALRDAQYSASSGSTSATTRSWASDTSTLESDQEGFNLSEVESTLGLLQSQVEELQKLKAHFDQVFLSSTNSEQVKASGARLDSRWRSLQSSSHSFIDECNEITNQLRAFSRQLDEKTTQRAEASEVLRTLSANRLRLPSSLGYSPSCCSSKSANRRRSSWRETLTEVEDSCASTNSRIHYDSDTESLQVEPPDEKLGNSDLINSSYDSFLSSSVQKGKWSNPLVPRRTEIPVRPDEITNVSALFQSSVFNSSAIGANSPVKTCQEMFQNAHTGCYEPLSSLQRLAETFQFSFILNKALVTQSSVKQIAFVGAFVVSTLYATASRKTIPFDALLGETYELDLRREQEGMWVFCEQVRQHPVPVTSLYAECNSGWKVHAQLSFNCQQQHDRIHIHNNSIFFLTLPNGVVYTWKGPDSVLMRGSPITGAFGSHFNKDDESVWVDHLGNVKITNSQENSSLVLNFRQYSFFSSNKKQPFSVSGIVYDKYSKPSALVQGRWNEFLELIDFNPRRTSLDFQRTSSVNSPILASHVTKSRASSFNVGESCEDKQKILLWNSSETWVTSKQSEVMIHNTENTIHPGMHNFSNFALLLNQPISAGYKNLFAPTDSRFRPDVRAFELGEIELSQKLKKDLLKKTCATCNDDKMGTSRANSATKGSTDSCRESPLWFSPSDSIEYSCIRDDDDGKQVTVHVPFYQFNGAYLLHKTSGDWRVCPKYLFRP